MAIATLHSIFSRIALLLGVIFLVACGGGGGGNKSSNSSSKAQISVSNSIASSVEATNSSSANANSSGNANSLASSAGVIVISNSSQSSVIDTTPTAVVFTPISDAALNTAVISNVITLSGINVAVPISITNGEYSINGGAFTSAAGTVSPAQTIAVKVVSSNINSTAVNATLTAGGVSATYSVTTLADAIPNAFTFTPAVGAELGSVHVSNIITIGGIETAVAISITGGEYSINGGAFTSAVGTVTNGQTISVRVVAPAGTELTQNAVVSIGGVSGTYAVTTIPDTTAPVAEFKFPTPYTMSETNSVKVRGTATDDHAIASVKVVVSSFNF
ncbi:MAG: hypothetical protein K0Q67_1742, partial [Cellvibrio sp.]|nr:hypothetical protein [Cellvibrio sp.]